MSDDLSVYVKRSGSDYDLTGLLSDPDACSKSIAGFMGMFDREIFDKIVCCGKLSPIVSGALAAKLGKPVVMAKDMSGGAISAGMKVVVICDALRGGDCVLSIIRSLEGAGAKVVRVGFIAELTECGARKSKVLRKYPFEALVTL